MPKQSNEKSQQRRQLIFDAAIKCFKNNGLNKASMRNIAEEAGVSLGNLYQYFPDKASLIKHFIIETNAEVEEIYASLSGPFPVKLIMKEIIKGYLESLSQEDETAIIYEIFIAGLRDDEIMAIIREHYIEEQVLAKKLRQAEQDKRVKLPAGAQATASAILAVIENNALKVQLEESFTVKQAVKDAWKVIDLLLV